MAEEIISKALVEKRIVKRGDQWCVVSEDGSKNLGCKSSEAGARKRLQQVEFFKHRKSLTDDEAIAYLDAGFPVDDAEVGLFVVKHLPALLEKHELLEEHAHNEIKADDVKISTGNEEEVEVGDAETVKEEDVGAEEKNYDKGVELEAGTTSAKQNLVKSDIVTHKDTGIVTEAELAQRRRDVRGRSAGFSPDMQRADEELASENSEGDLAEKKAAYLKERESFYALIARSGIDPHVERGTHECAKCGAEYKPHEEIKHLPGKHDQQSHAGVGGTIGRVAHTPAQLKEAAARQHAKDTGMSLVGARKKVGVGAKVSTTKLIDLHEPTEVKRKLTPSEFRRKKGLDRSIDEEKSLIAKADQACLKSLWSEYYKYYSGKWIAAAWNFYKAGKFSQAKQAFEKARDGFQSDKNPKEYDCLDAWAKDAEGKIGEKKHLPGQHDQQSHAGKGVRIVGDVKGKGKRGFVSQVSPRGDYFGIEDAKGNSIGYYHGSDLKFEELSPDNALPIYNKSLLRFVPPLIQSEWRITKASTGEDGIMRWQATTTRFSRDVQGDRVTRQFYEEAAKRFKSKAVPPPFFSVAHYSAYEDCSCGHVFKSLNDYACPQCGEERLLAGVTTDIWVDGDQPKAKGVFFPTELGRETYKQIKSDIQSKTPHDERIRISMGFYPDPGKGTITKSAGHRDFMSGWIEHFAGTRVPVVPETIVEVE